MSSLRLALKLSMEEVKDKPDQKDLSINNNPQRRKRSYSDVSIDDVRSSKKAAFSSEGINLI